MQHHGATLVFSFDLAAVTLAFKISSRLCLGNRKILQIDPL